MEDLRNHLLEARSSYDIDGVSKALAEAPSSVAAAAVDSIDPDSRMIIHSRKWPVTPLSSAVFTGNHELIKTLVQYRSREAALKTTWFSDDKGPIEVDTWWLPFRALLQTQSSNCADLLDTLACDLSDLVTGAEQELGRLVWLWAAQNNLDRFVEALLDAGFPVNMASSPPTLGERTSESSPYSLPRTALWEASAHGGNRVVDVLLRRGAIVSSSSKGINENKLPSNMFAVAQGLEDKVGPSLRIFGHRKPVYDDSHDSDDSDDPDYPNSSESETSIHGGKGNDDPDHWKSGITIDGERSDVDNYTAIIHALLDNGEDPHPEPIRRGSTNIRPGVKYGDEGLSDPAICQFTALGLVSVVQRLLEITPSLATCCFDGQTLLHYAIRSRYHCMVAKVLEWSRLPGNSIIASLLNEQSLPPLIYCVMYGTTGILRLLLDFGINPNTRGSAGMTALLLATSLNKLGMVRELLARQADPNLILSSKAMSEPAETFPLLSHAYGYRVSGSPLLLAFAQLEEIPPHRQPSIFSGEIDSLAYRRRTYKIIKMLLASKASMVVPSFVATKKEVHNGRSKHELLGLADAWVISQVYPYEYAVRVISNVKERVGSRWELSPGEYVSFAHHIVDAIQASFQGVIPLPVLDSCLRTLCRLTVDSDGCAFFHGLYSAVERFLDLGADARVELPYGATLLHICSDSIRYETSDEDRESVVRGRIRRLLSLGLPVSIMDDTGRTPLHCAVLRHQAAVSELLDNGANPLFRDWTTSIFGSDKSGDEELGLTALDLCVSNSRAVILEAVKALLLHTPSDRIDWGRLLRRACASRVWTIEDSFCELRMTQAHLMAMDWILAAAQAANPRILLQQDKNGDTPLHIACGANSDLALTAICSIHVPWQVYCMQDSLGRTPLMRVLAWRDKNMTEFMLEAILGGISKAVAIPDISLTEASTSNLDENYIHAENHFNFSRRRFRVQETLSQPLPYDHLLPENAPFQPQKNKLKPLPDNGICLASAEQRAQCLNMCDDAGWTAIHYAIAADSIHALDILLQVPDVVVEETSRQGAPSPMALAKLTGEQYAYFFGKIPDRSILLILSQRKKAEVSRSAGLEHSDDSDGDDGGVYLSNIPKHPESDGKAAMSTHTQAQSSYLIWVVRLACLSIIVFASMFLILRMIHRN